MLRTTLSQIRLQDNDVWRTATRSSPIVVQFVWAALFGIGWLLGRRPVESHIEFRILVTVATVLTTVVALSIGKALLRSDSTRRRGVGLGIAGSGIAVLVGGLAFALIFLPIVEPAS
ncbi:hypothetical protein MTER_34630 [Mycolicibacter terrae]|uniref:Transmembrane protein n=1 Tax=Mycolicibacter terrae TaxID=1788 RepID=A0AAD1HYM6_9MYCO|nr:hypothetical protein [Mycolicibacter terrae]BBX24052.1 hypothetical protein MTER_34630 [Mycolicibacter terrae]SNV56932.1 Uncharacterised protein [Mycolicibacter terrae]